MEAQQIVRDVLDSQFERLPGYVFQFVSCGNAVDEPCIVRCLVDEKLTHWDWWSRLPCAIVRIVAVAQVFPFCQEIWHGVVVHRSAMFLVFHRDVDDPQDRSQESSRPPAPGSPMHDAGGCRNWTGGPWRALHDANHRRRAAILPLFLRVLSPVIVAEVNQVLAAPFEETLYDVGTAAAGVERVLVKEEQGCPW